MRWTRQPRPHDFLLSLSWCPFLLFVLLWWSWVGSSRGGMWLAWGQIAGGVLVLLGVHLALGGWGTRDVFWGRFLPGERWLGLFLWGSVVSSLVLAGGGWPWGAWVVSCGGVIGVVSSLRWRRGWVTEGAIWSGPYPLQSLPFAQLRHVWFDEQALFAQGDEARFLIFPRGAGQTEASLQEAVHEILAAQARWLSQTEEGVCGVRSSSGWALRWGEVEAPEALGVTEEVLEETQPGMGQLWRTPWWQRSTGVLLGVVWVLCWWGGRGVDVGTGLRVWLVLCLGIAICLQIGGFPWPLRLLRWRESARPPAAKAATQAEGEPSLCWSCMGLQEVGRLQWVVVLPCSLCLVLWGGWMVWQAGEIGLLPLLMWQAGLAAWASLASGRVWMARWGGAPWLRRELGVERVEFEKLEAFWYSRGLLLWRHGEEIRRMMLPCEVSSREVARWLLGEESARSV